MQSAPLSLEVRELTAERDTLYGLPAVFASDLLPTDTFTLIGGFEREPGTWLSGSSALERSAHRSSWTLRMAVPSAAPW